MDLYPHQLAAPASVPARLGRQAAGHGLVVVGVRTPEFGFQHDPDNVRRAMQDRRIAYPVAAHNDYAVWRAFGAYYWLAL